MKKARTIEKTMTAMEYRKFREDHPLLVVGWEGAHEITDGETNVLMHQDFLSTIRVRVDLRANTLTLLPTEDQLRMLLHSGLVPKVVCLIDGHKTTIHSFPVFCPMLQISDAARRATLTPTMPIPARF